MGIDAQSLDYHPHRYLRRFNALICIIRTHTAALHPDEFLLHQLELEPLFVLPAFKAMRARLKNPLFTPEAFADSMNKNGLVQTAAFLRQALQLI